MMLPGNPLWVGLSTYSSFEHTRTSRGELEPGGEYFLCCWTSRSTQDRRTASYPVTIEETHARQDGSLAVGLSLATGKASNLAIAQVLGLDQRLDVQQAPLSIQLEGCALQVITAFLTPDFPGMEDELRKLNASSQG